MPGFLEQAILDELELSGLSRSTSHKFNRQLSKLRKQLRALSRDFAVSLPTEDQYSDAYYAYNFPMNFMKAWFIGKQLFNLCSRSFTNKKRIAVLDLGCGAGAGMLGLSMAFDIDQSILLTGVDGSSVMLSKCRRLSAVTRKHREKLHVHTIKDDISDGFMGRKKKYDIVFIANTLTEIFLDQSIPLFYVERLIKHLDNSGCLVIIEPATKVQSRKLMDLRDVIINKKKGTVLLPCFHREECPLMYIRNQKEWCHQSIDWQPPEYLRVINQGLNREIDVLKFSYLVISKKASADIPKDCWLLISSLLREKGKKKCFLCAPEGRIELTRLNKHRSGKNKIFDTLIKGDIIHLENYRKRSPRIWRIEQDTRLKRYNYFNLPDQ